MKNRTLEDWRKIIEDEREFVDIKPSSDILVSNALRAIEIDFGREEANKAIEDFGLEEIGWCKL